MCKFQGMRLSGDGHIPAAGKEEKASWGPPPHGLLGSHCSTHKKNIFVVVVVSADNHIPFIRHLDGALNNTNSNHNV